MCYSAYDNDIACNYTFTCVQSNLTISYSITYQTQYASINFQQDAEVEQDNEQDNLSLAC